MKNKWEIQVIFIGEYDQLFDEKELEEKKDSQYRFQIALENIIEQTGIVPSIGDWVDPLPNPYYPLDIARIGGRIFFPAIKKIQFEIE